MSSLEYSRGTQSVRLGCPSPSLLAEHSRRDFGARAGGQPHLGAAVLALTELRRIEKPPLHGARHAMH
jgi:hypothetical protein